MPHTSGAKRSTISSQAAWSPARARRTRSTITGSSRIAPASGPRVGPADLGDRVGWVVPPGEQRRERASDLAGRERGARPRRPAVEVDDLLVPRDVAHEHLLAAGVAE